MPTCPLEISVYLRTVHVSSLLSSALPRPSFDGTISFTIFLQCVVNFPALILIRVDRRLRRRREIGLQVAFFLHSLIRLKLRSLYAFPGSHYWTEYLASELLVVSENTIAAVCATVPTLSQAVSFQTPLSQRTLGI